MAATKKRLLNDEEFAAFAATGAKFPWEATEPCGLLAWVLEESPYGSDGICGIPYTYSSLACQYELGDPEFPIRMPDEREFWNCPNRCDWITPAYNEIANEALPGYNFKTYRLYEGEYGHTESVGVHPETGDIVALGLNVSDIEDTLKHCGYPDTEYVDSDLSGLLARRDFMVTPKHEQTTLKIDEDLEFEVDKQIAPLIDACWHNGAVTIMSCEKTDEGTAYITFYDPLCADYFLTAIFANGDISWDGNKVDPADWRWTSYGPFGPEDDSRTTVNVYFPPELIGLLTKSITSEKSTYPEPGKMISELLPEVEEEVQRRLAEIEKQVEEDD